MKCLGKNQKGLTCIFKPLENDQYCKLHQTYKKMINLQNEGKKVCKNWVRGCWNILSDNYERCLNCRLNEREKEKKLREKKKENSIKFNSINKDKFMCNECNSITIEYKNNKCQKCYTTLYMTNKNRKKRELYDVKIQNYKCGAKNRNLNFNLTDEKCIELFNKSCYYCSLENTDEKINGIDRIDSNNHYTIENCVPCCTQCNLMKNNKDQDVFIDLCEHIATYNKLYNGRLYKNLLKNTKFGKFSEYIKSANKRNIKFGLTKEQFIELISKKCDYCGVEEVTYYKTVGSGGIDRVNSNKDYTIDNCVSCCGQCNIMKLDYTKNEFLTQCLNIIKNQKNSKNKSDIEDKIIDKFYKFQNINKKEKQEFNHSKEYYENRIWSEDLNELKNIKLKLIFIDDNKELMDIWNYYKYTVSSLKLTKNSHLVGRQLYFLIADEKTDKYLGIISLTSDYLYLSDRDDFIGWTKEKMIDEKKLNYILNLSTCVPLQPFGFNFTGGKLLTKLVFSQEIQDIFRNKYKHPLLGITTTSLYGKSIQYDRLKEIKLIGYTKGNSVYKYSTEFIKLCKKYLLNYHSITLNNKLHIISKTLEKLELPKDEFMKDNPKGIYFGFIYQDSKDFLCDKIKKIKETPLKSINEIFNDWILSFATKRYNNLLQNNIIKIIQNNSSAERTKKYYERLKNKIGEEEYKKINNEKVKKHRENKNNEKIKTYNKKPDLPDNFSLYQEKNVWYLSFSKKIDTLRYNKKIKLNSMCIQTELDRLINIINTEFPNLKINQYTVQNPYNFIDNTQLKENNRPKLPSNFCITNINKVDYIQFSKKINDKKVCYKTNIKSYDLQKDLNNFVDNLNKKYNFNIPEQKIINMNDWKTTNKIV